ncbi:C4-dicarboxylate ABC transporter permease, partial [Halorubrum ezzemoulense]
MATNPDTPTDPTDPPDDPVPEDSLLGDEEPLDLADGDRGSKQLWLYLLSLPFWVLVVFGPAVVAPALLGAEIDGSATIVGVVGVIGVAGIAGLILWLGSGIEERLRMALISYSIPFWMIVMWYSYTQQMPRGQYAVAFLGGILALYVISELDEPLIEGNWIETGLLVVSGLITLGTSGYLFLNYQQVAIDTVGRATEAQIAMAFAFTLAMIYLTWRSFGITFLAVVLIGIGYGLTGPYMPGALSHGGLSPSRILRILVVSVDGFYGFLTRLVAAWIALFLLYAGLLKAYGAFDLILRLAVRSAKYVDSGIAQTAVIASAVIGSVNGSQTANAGMTGSFTIPLMKENGIKPETAGGIEAVASTAGQVLPPVMG